MFRRPRLFAPCACKSSRHACPSSCMTHAGKKAVRTVRQLPGVGLGVAIGRGWGFHLFRHGCHLGTKLRGVQLVHAAHLLLQGEDGGARRVHRRRRHRRVLVRLGDTRLERLRVRLGLASLRLLHLPQRRRHLRVVREGGWPPFGDAPSAQPRLGQRPQLFGEAQGEQAEGVLAIVLHPHTHHSPLAVRAHAASFDAPVE